MTALEEVAIINDDASEQQAWAMTVADAGYKPYLIQRRQDGPFRDVQQLVQAVEDRARFAVCDHRLSPKGFATFTGAQAVAALNKRQTTATILVSTYWNIDVDVAIRQFRVDVPVLLKGSEFDPESLRGSLDKCRDELNGHIPSHRKRHRTIVQIEARSTESGADVCDALIPGWNPLQKVRFPLNLIQVPLWDRAIPGALFLANVNIGTELYEDLFLCDFVIAPEPNPNDGLA